MTERIFKGIAVSPGSVIGKAFIFDSEEDVVIEREIADGQIPVEIARFEDALIATRREIIQIQDKITEAMGAKHAEIFNAHLLVLEDRALIEDVIEKLEQEKKNIEWVFSQVARKYAKIFSRVEDEYLKERAADVKDVTRRILHTLLGKKRQDIAELKEEVVIVAYDLSPSDTALMHKEKVIGFASDVGGKTSHTAILARSIGNPGVVGLHDASKRIKSGQTVIVDGNRGIVIVSPSGKTLEKYQKEQRKLLVFEEKLSELKDLPAETIDGYRVVIAANIELPEDVPVALAHGAQGIGLYRTEFFYMNRTGLPTEEEHYKAYREVAEGIHPHPVTIRTFDLGGDKFVSHLDVPREMNPFLGWRAIRFCLERVDIFKVQLRAILRASALGNVKVMFPMISGVEELKAAIGVLNEAKRELRKENVPFDRDIQVGAMIEIPSAALTADILAKEVDFFSIGTNDLIQYSLAVDRVNEKIAYLYEPRHPAVLRLIRDIIEAAHSNGIWVAMCGEMASEPSLTLILLGLALDEFSVSAVAIPEIKKVVRSVTLQEARTLAREVMSMEAIGPIRRKTAQLVRKAVPELIRLKGQE
ncbi:MAG: phosphoenolpyruvate--protein phosphotransferase [Candidatus Tritonobacter lacicola]|nr:phosphoenolpyruvate--protein phosphotransferase [Candidatus Tritonobacter lacicola]